MRRKGTRSFWQYYVYKYLFWMGGRLQGLLLNKKYVVKYIVTICQRGLGLIKKAALILGIIF